MAMKGVAGMSNLSAESANPHDALRGVINAFYHGGADAPLVVEFLLGLTTSEQEEFLAGNDAVWLAKKTPERLQRLDAFVTQLHTAWWQHRAEELRHMSAQDGGTQSPPIPVFVEFRLPPT
jgi:hypothetical protein